MNQNKRKELQILLDEYNDRIASLIKERTKFLDENMHIFADFQIGEEVVHVRGGKTKVKEHYRYWRNRSDLDDSFETHCRFENGDNTSCHGAIHPYVKISDKENRTDEYIFRLKNSK